jgi:hypothetical protein
MVILLTDSSITTCSPVSMLAMGMWMAMLLFKDVVSNPWQQRIETLLTRT